jgi:hypothetical protein
MPLFCEKGVSEKARSEPCFPTFQPPERGEDGTVLPYSLQLQYYNERKTVLGGSESTREPSNMRELEET